MTPTDSNTTRQSLDLISNKLDHVKETVDTIKTDVKCLDQKQNAFEKTYIKEHQIVVSMATDNREEVIRAHRRIDEIEKSMKELQRTIQPLVATNKILTVLGGILATSVIALIWSIVTHQVSIVFP